MVTTVTQEQGYTGLALKIPRVITQSTLVQVTAAGWWNNNPINGQVALNPQDLVAICYAYGSSSQSSALFSVSIGANGVVTLTLSESSVITPTIANHIATYTNTSGTLSEDPATAISGGNIQAGLTTGTAGTFISCNSTNARGTLIWKSIASSGNFNITVSNASHGQSSVYSIPDTGVATSTFIMADSAGTQTIATGSLALTVGNFTATAGNIQAGSSGHAGLFTSFPGTASNGSFIFKAINNSGGFASTLSNSNIAQATVYSLPDTTTATANVLAAGSALVSGNLVQASGTAGAVVDSGVTASGLQILSASVSLNQSQVQNMYTTPIQIVAASANKVIVPVQSTVYTNFQTAAFSGGGVGILQYDNTTHGGGTNALTATIPAAEITAGSSQIYSLGGVVASALTGITNKGLFLSNQTGAFAGGNAASTVVVTVSYYLVTATV